MVAATFFNIVAWNNPSAESLAMFGFSVKPVCACATVAKTQIVVCKKQTASSCSSNDLVVSRGPTHLWRGDRTEVHILYPKKSQLQNLPTQKKSLLFLIYQKNPLVLFFTTQTNPSVFFRDPKKIPASFINPKKITLGKISDPKKSLGPPPPPIKI